MKKLRMIRKILLILMIIAAVVILIGLLFLRFYPSIGKLPDDEQKRIFSHRTNLYYDSQFHNENEVPLMTGEGYPSSSRKKPQKTIHAETPDLITDPTNDDLTYTWIGHSSFLLQLGTINILVDPVLSEMSSPVSFAGSRRFSELPIRTGELPRIDVLLLSHDHYDHMDYKTIRDISSRIGVFVVPLGVDSILRGWGIENERIVALDWWENTEVNGTIITLTPSQHYTGRNPLKSNSTYWGNFCICNHAWDDPIIRVTAKSTEMGVNIATPRIGQTVDYEKIDSFNEPWWEEYE